MLDKFVELFDKIMVTLCVFGILIGFVVLITGGSWLYLVISAIIGAAYFIIRTV